MYVMYHIHEYYWKDVMCSVYIVFWDIQVYKILICSIFYYMIRVYILMSYKFDILYSTVFGFQCNSNSTWVYLCNLCIRYIHLSEKYIIFFVYTPSWVILVSQNLTCSNVYDMFSVYSLMNCNFDIVHSSGAFHCNSNQG